MVRIAARAAGRRLVACASVQLYYVRAAAGQQEAPGESSTGQKQASGRGGASASPEMRANCRVKPGAAADTAPMQLRPERTRATGYRYAVQREARPGVSSTSRAVTLAQAISLRLHLLSSTVTACRGATASPQSPAAAGLSPGLNHMGQLILMRAVGPGGDATTPEQGNRLHFPHRNGGLSIRGTQSEITDGRELGARRRGWLGARSVGHRWPLTIRVRHSLITVVACFRPGLACWRVPRGEAVTRSCVPKTFSFCCELSRNAIGLGLLLTQYPMGMWLRPCSGWSLDRECVSNGIIDVCFAVWRRNAMSKPS
ncbi:hypothetical protein G7Z17_g1303 [Cylindrodendrum hubeiense]|uniref:Uncharacterized protein n=1 Tax=Cylindrodendrum hubeiense TaxID=595255 RepID=A0A9P5HJM0_9HYPO|nr:hypothetical protein G7Z17_g1303 [Cylindrodendrum hubeiense]